METRIFFTLICLQLGIATASPNGRIYKAARGHVHRRRELQELNDPCAAEELSNDQDISNDERARSNVFRRGSGRRRLKVAGKALIAGKANIGKAVAKADTGKAVSSSSSSSSKSKVPSDAPSMVPSTAAPSVSNGDVGSNDFGIDSRPTLSPTGVLRTPVSTCIPTKLPVAPTPWPTNKPYITDSDTAVSTCMGDPDEDGIFEDELLHFKYNLYVATGTDQTSSMILAEMLIHYGLADEFLTCDFEDDFSPDIFAIDSSRNATVLTEECDKTDDPIPPVETDCVVILSDVNLTAFYPFSSFPYSLPNPAIKNATGFYLNSSMARGDFVWGDVIQTVFKGFVEDDNSTGVAGIVVGRGAAAGGGGSSGVLVGSALSGIAALCLLLFLLFAVQRHRRRSDPYKGPGESLGGTFSNGSDPGLESLSDGRVQLVLNEEFDFGEEDPHLGFHEQPDVHHCNSAMCPICRQKNGPTFLKTQTQPDDEARWPQPSTNTRLPARSYDSVDTVDM
ncbi:unnamed protein product [Cylindrotheca closterium]|uniref:Subtilisin n=1 Tax=Cylindrotheca closterium TaxID=2856 RepID=A0AAD2FLT5_9STRA|nr:unnamed protein product [Cylindrotheca closterium]